jgi:predicted TIM-barrel fold metal-dependent hydrolase
MPFSRREFTQLSVAAGALTLVQGQSFAARFGGIPIIDTHQHLWDLVQFQPPWLDGADAKIAAKHDTNDYRTETEGLNIVKAVYMEVDVAPADQIKEAEYVLALIQSGKTPTVGAVISGRPDSDGFASYMAKFSTPTRRSAGFACSQDSFARFSCSARWARVLICACVRQNWLIAHNWLKSVPTQSSS